METSEMIGKVEASFTNSDTFYICPVCQDNHAKNPKPDDVLNVIHPTDRRGIYMCKTHGKFPVQDMFKSINREGFTSITDDPLPVL